MFRHFFTSTVAAMLLGSSAFAGDLAGTYAAQTPQGPLVIELCRFQGNFGGAVQVSNGRYPIVAIQSGDYVSGIWNGQGKDIPFTGSLDGNSLILATNGKIYRLQKVDPAVILARTANQLNAAHAYVAPQQPVAVAVPPARVDFNVQPGAYAPTILPNCQNGAIQHAQATMNGSARQVEDWCNTMCGTGSATNTSTGGLVPLGNHSVTDLNRPGSPKYVPFHITPGK